MFRWLPVFAVLLLALPAAASAAAFGEPGFRPAGGPATCLRATGYPGELVRATKTGAQFLQAGAGGLVPVADVTNVRPTSECPAAAGRVNGAGIVALPSYSASGSEVWVQVALREPGAGWGAPAEVAALPEFSDGNALAADVSERGDALVAFAGGAPKRWKVRAVRRAVGGVFAKPETVFAAGKSASSNMRVAAGLSAAGEAVVAWSFQPAAGKPREVWVAVAPAGAAFGAPSRIGTLRNGSPFSLAVGASGHALVAFPRGHDLLVAQRDPGAGFGPASRVGAATDRLAVSSTVAVGPDGGAIVAWQNSLAGDLQAVIRSQPGGFSAPITLAPESGLRVPESLLAMFDALVGDDAGEFTTDGPDDDGTQLRAVITPNGRAVVTAPGVEQRDGAWYGGARVATIALTGDARETHVLGAGLRDADGLAPVLTADGTVGIAWSDNNAQRRDGRLHLALEGATDGADPVPPQVRLIGSTRRVVKPDEELRYKVRCSAACDVHVQLGDGALAPAATVSRTRAGEQAIRLYGLYKPLATLKGGPVKLLVRYGAPGARRATAKTLTLNLRRLPDAPRPHVLDPVARRDGNAIVVTWRTDRDAKPTNFLIYATRTRNGPIDPFDAYLLGALGGYADDDGVTGSGRRFSKHVTEDVDGARYVKIVAHVKGARKTDTTTVRVLG